MAGQFCAGSGLYEGLKNAKKQNMLAYAEGVEARAEGLTPVNPHVAGSEAGLAWAKGVLDCAGDTIAGCCAPATAAV